VTNEEITSLSIKPEIWKKWVKEAFLMKETSMLPHKISQTFDQGRKYYNTMPALMPDINTAGVKIVSRYPERKPTIQGELLLYDMTNFN